MENSTNWATEPLNLSSGNIRVRTLQESDIDAVAEAVSDPTGWSGTQWDWNSLEKTRAALETQLAAHERGETHPFVYFVGNEVAGFSRYLNLAPGRKALEIGTTCVAPRWRRTFVNTEVKYLLLEHAFERIGAVRVELRVDCLNYTSQMNVLRLGASFEGKIRNWQVRKDGSLPDGMLYSITNKEWPAVKERLGYLRQRKMPPSRFLSFESESERIRFRQFRLPDAEQLLRLVRDNHGDLVEGFPGTSRIESLLTAQSYIAEKAHSANSGSEFFYGAWTMASNELIGQIGIKQVDWKSRSADIGYFVDQPFRRKGIGEEMVRRAIDELWESHGFKRVTLRIIPNNIASLGLAYKLGFQKEGILKSAFLTGTGKWEDVVQLALVR